MVVSSGMHEPDPGEPFVDQSLSSCGDEPLQQLLQDQPGRHNDVVPAEGIAQCLDFRSIG